MLELSGVGMRRDGITLLSDFDLRLPDPGIYLLCGPSSSGKSLLGRMLAGRLRPDRGKVLLDGAALYPERGPLALLRSVLRAKPSSGALFYAEAGRCPEAGESLYRYLDYQMWRAGAPATALQPFWDALERQIPAAARRAVGSLSLSELSLAHIALGAAIPARVVVLDGQWGCLDGAGHETAQRLLRLIAAPERFVVLTAPVETGEVARAARIDLAGGLPVSLLETGTRKS